MKTKGKTFTLEQIAKLTCSKFIGNKEQIISGVNDLKSAREEEASFLANPRYKELLDHTAAGVICIDLSTKTIPGKNFLISENPSETFQKIAETLLGIDGPPTTFIGVHETAVVHKSATIKENISIGPYSVVDRNAKIDANSTIYPHVFIGADVQIGKDCTIYPGVIIREGTIIHDRVIIQPGAIIGSCGFGYSFDPEKGKFEKLKQLGIVILEDDVEIGANTTIDRARFNTTVISKGTKIDNLVQIGHNVIVGENNAIVSQTGIAGSTKTGKNVLLGGQCGIVGHVEIGDNVKIATRGGVSKSITTPGAYRGSPVMPIGEYNKNKVYLRKIKTYVKRIEALEKRITELENR